MKRDELLSTVPMSISVLSADRLRESGINDIRGVAAVSSGVEYNFSSQFGPGILTDIGSAPGIGTTEAMSIASIRGTARQRRYVDHGMATHGTLLGKARIGILGYGRHLL
jgi:hypothetical protein